jgi:hypothetical protein
MGVFDQATRYAAEAEPEAIVTRLLRGLAVRLRFDQWLDTRTTPRPGDPERTADRVAALVDEALHDPDKLDVTLVEAGQLRLRCRHGDDRQGTYNILTALVYLRGVCPTNVLDMTLPGGMGTRHAPLVWNLAEDSAAEALAGVASGQQPWGLLFWVPLMQGGGDPATVQRWKEMASALPDRRQRGDLGQIALVFAELAGCYLAWEQALKGWDMTESQVVNRWVQEARDQALLERGRADLLRLLQKRFPEAVTSEVIATINAQPSLSILDDWFDAAISAYSPAAFLAVLKR